MEAVQQHANSLAPRLVTVRGAAKILALGESTIYAMIAAGDPPHIRVGRAMRLAVDDLERWIQERKVRAA